MRIPDLALIEVAGEFPPATFFHLERTALPMDASGDQGDGGWGTGSAAGPRRLTQSFLEGRTDAGVCGLCGPVDGAHVMLLRHELQQRVLGADPVATERVWDQVLRSNRP